MARLPLKQLQMLKLLCNQTAESMGMASSRTLGTLFDGIARHTQEGLDFVARSGEIGFRDAVRERDDPFGDYGSGPRSKRRCGWGNRSVDSAGWRRLCRPSPQSRSLRRRQERNGT